MTKICDNTSVGMLVYKGDKILLIERKKYPFGFAIPAGHVDDKGTFENAAKEELEEEVGLKAKKLELIEEGRRNNPCRRKGGSWHYWKLYQVEAEGKLKPSRDETKQAGWYTKEQIEKLARKTEQYLAGKIPEDKWQASPGLEPTWYTWFLMDSLANFCFQSSVSTCAYQAPRGSTGIYLKSAVFPPRHPSQSRRRYPHMQH